MANERAIRRRAKLALSALACLLCQGRAVAASDVADAVMHKDPARLQALIAASADVNSAQPDGTTALRGAAAQINTRSGTTKPGRRPGTAPAGSSAFNRIESTE